MTVWKSEDNRSDQWGMFRFRVIILCRVLLSLFLNRESGTKSNCKGDFRNWFLTECLMWVVVNSSVLPFNRINEKTSGPIYRLSSSKTGCDKTTTSKARVKSGEHRWCAADWQNLLEMFWRRFDWSPSLCVGHWLRSRLQENAGFPTVNRAHVQSHLYWGDLVHLGPHGLDAVENLLLVPG